MDKKKKPGYVLNATTNDVDIELDDKYLTSFDGQLKYRMSENLAVNVETGEPEMIFPFPGDKDDD